jgi:GT2 family glycosyltransferase
LGDTDLNKHHPAFSVIIPAHGRPRQLRECLSALTKLLYPADRYEVIVVDDGSPQRLDAVVDPFRGQMDLQLLRQANAGPGAARNRGAATAANDYLAFTDDDCQPDPNWLCELAARIRRHPDRMVGGKTINRLTANPYAMASQLIVDAVYDYYNRDPGAARFLASNNMAVPANVFRRLGGFDPDFQIASEDRDLCDRWLHAGHEIAYAPSAAVRHSHELTFRRFCKQHFNYGRGATQYHRVRADRNSGRMRDDMGFHARLLQLLRGPLSRVPARQALPACALLAAWQVSNAAGFFYEHIRRLTAPSVPAPVKRPPAWKGGWPNR